MHDDNDRLILNTEPFSASVYVTSLILSLLGIALIVFTIDSDLGSFLLGVGV
jgi:hypothetical protein